MKRLSMVLVGMSLICSLLTGCGNTDVSEKMCRLEIISAEDSKVIKTLDNITQDDAAAFLDVNNDMDISGFKFAEMDISDDEIEESELVPEYRIILYQKKTETIIKSGDEYEKIIEFITYKDSDCIKMMILGDAAKGIDIDDDFLSIYYKGTDVFFDNLHENID